MSRRKKKFVYGRGPRLRSKFSRLMLFLLVFALVFVPWQAVVLHQTATLGARFKQGLLGVSTNAPEEAPPPAPVLRNLADPLHDYGIAEGSELTQMDTAALNKRLAAIRAIGVGWLRFDVEWAVAQPNDAGSYDWSAYDKIVAAAGAQRLKMIGVLRSTPRWARGNCGGDACPPANQQQFAAFAARAAARYEPKGLQVWEVWNEPNTARYWAPQPDAVAYAHLLRVTYPAIRMANPQAIVISGGLSPLPTSDENIAEIDFLPQMYAAGAKGYFDAVGAHPYSYPFIPSHNSQQGWSRLAFTANNLRSTMTANGDGAKKIWLTEFGAPTDGQGPAATLEDHRTLETNHVDEALQAQIITKAAELYRTYDWVGPLIWYTYIDPGTVSADGAHSYGLVHENGTHKSSYEALERAIMGH